MTLQGKGMMIWKIQGCEDGNAAAIGSVAKAAGFSHVLIKIANDTRPYNLDSSGRDLVMPVVDALRANGIQVWGWHYVYGYDPIGEANIAISQTKKFSLDGYVIDAEVEYKAAGRDAVARTFMSELRKGIPSTPVALCSFRWPSYHRTFPWTAFLEKCDLNMPQVYWMHAHNPAYDLNRCISEFKAINPWRPIVPTGPAFGQDGWAPTAPDVKTFLETARSLNLSAANFYSWDYSRNNLAPVWNEIVKHDWSTARPPVSSDPLNNLFASLNTMQYMPITDYYAEKAVLVTSKETVQGNDKIRFFFAQMLQNELNDGEFTITSRAINGNTIHYTWTCNSYRGKVTDGSDTIGLKDGKIVYHYCYYTVS